MFWMKAHTGSHSLSFYTCPSVRDATQGTWHSLIRVPFALLGFDDMSNEHRLGLRTWGRRPQGSSTFLPALLARAITLPFITWLRSGLSGSCWPSSPSPCCVLPGEVPCMEWRCLLWERRSHSMCVCVGGAFHISPIYLLSNHGLNKYGP